MNLARKLLLMSGNGAAINYLLDDAVLTAFAAYSTRILRRQYAGQCLRLRRSSDNAESDFGFNSQGVLDFAAITTWLGGATGFVRTWYDQSGNTRHIEQATAANQPTIVDSVQASNAGVRSDGTNDFMRRLTVTLNQPFSVYSAWIPRTLNTRHTLSFSNAFFIQNTSQLTINAGSSVSTAIGLLALNTAVVGTGVFNGASSVVSVNGGNVATGNAGAGNGDRIHAFSDAAASSPANIDMLTSVIFNTADDATQRAVVNSWFSSIYSIPLV